MTIHVHPLVSPQACPALVLNADYRPLSYYPLSLWSWQDAIKAVFLDRVNIVSEYDRQICSPSFAMRLPSVVSLKTYVKPSRTPAFTRFNVFLRDRFTCQYCGAHEELTFDHVIPRSKGGLTTWENVVSFDPYAQKGWNRRGSGAGRVDRESPASAAATAAPAAAAAAEEVQVLADAEGK